MSLYYSAKDESALIEALPRICTEHRRAELKVEPTADQRTEVFGIILDFIRSKDRIVYGGYALHLLIQEKSKEDFIYTDLDFPDVEFYTPNLKEDVQELANLIHEKGFECVRAEEGVHPTTFVFRVSSEQVCDVSFLPQKFLDVVPTVTINRLRVVSPDFAMVDNFKVYCYPLNNFFRLKKSFTRANLLLKHYPLGFASHKLYGSPFKHEELVTRLIQQIAKDTVVTCGYAQNVYVKHAGLASSAVPVGFFTVMSIAFHDHIKFLTDSLSKSFPITTKYYLPFLEHLGQRCDIFTGDKILVRLYEEKDTCIPFREHEGLQISTLQATVYYSMAMWLQSLVEKRAEAEKYHQTIITNLVRAKSKFYASNPTKKITDPGLFQEFVVVCIGTFVSALRKFSIERRVRKEHNKAIKYSYEPGEKNKNLGFQHMHTRMSVAEPVIIASKKPADTSSHGQADNR